MAHPAFCMLGETLHYISRLSLQAEVHVDSSESDETDFESEEDVRGIHC